jgi:hypothetical protein
MRYEIFFVSSGPMTSPQVAFEHYFEKRPLYKVGRGTARYENTDTGVRFAFDCTAEPVVPPGAQRPWARFMIELLRPSFFPEEATREIEPFVRHFETRVLDEPGLPPIPYSPATFLRGWHEASRREYEQALVTAEEQGVPLSRMSRKELLAAWQWNYHRRVLQSHEGDGLFVPRIWFLRTAGGMSTSVIWPEAMAARVPQVDFVIFSRGAFAGSGDAPVEGADVALVQWDAVAPAIQGSAVYDSLSMSWRVTEPAMLKELGELVTRVPSTPRLPDVVPLDTVLDEEGFVTDP